MRIALGLLAGLALSACAGPAPDAALGRLPPPPGPSAPEVAARPAVWFLDEPMQCVPYARKVSGIQIRGDAWTWWNRAAGRYRRGPDPAPGSVMVLARSGRMRHGHLGVVRRVVSARELQLTHTNWGWDRRTRRMVHEAMSVIDVSPANDWSEVRLMNAVTQDYGRVYPVQGFIHAEPAGRPT